MYQGHLQVMGEEEIGHWALERAFTQAGYEELSKGVRVKVETEGEFSRRGKDSRAADKTVAMVLKEIPSKASSEGKPLLTVTTKLVSEQQESRPLLSPSIDDFLCETKCDGVSRPVTSNTAANKINSGKTATIIAVNCSVSEQSFNDRHS
ncbi:hypothetical protein L3Q82_007980 [Scortum barcoo]|uniref:Uncharacterized protein n=1 Tax=Scortum barcoo TaxID=214431 RepID=A0ACB8WJX2_9TELE|nr:hypothetical protein L3Q82_007980 [Scortum barcoo]